MKNLALFLLLLVAFNTKGVLEELGVVVPVEEEGKTRKGKMTFPFGDDHTENCNPEDNQAQKEKFLHMYDKAELESKQTYLTFVEGRSPLERTYNSSPSVLNDLLVEATARNYKKSVIENVDEIRECEAAALFLLRYANRGGLRKKIEENMALIKLSFPHIKDITQLTLRDVLDNYYTLLDEARRKIGTLPDEESNRVYAEKFASAESFHAEQIKEILEMVHETKESLLEYSMRMWGDPQDRAKRISGDLILIFAGLFDLNLFFKVIEAESRVPEKIIVIVGAEHAQDLIRALKDTKRYRCLGYFSTCQKIYKVGTVAFIENKPLHFFIFELVEEPREKLEWEINKVRKFPQLQGERPELKLNYYNF